MPESSITEPIDDWLPQLLQDDWSDAADGLVGEGTDVPVTDPPTIKGADDDTGGSVKNKARVKVFNDTDETETPMSWGDTDKDRTTVATIVINANGSSSKALASSARQIIKRVLERHRDNPHTDWHRFESWSSRKTADYPDHQRIVFEVNLAARGIVMPTSLEDR